MIGRADIKDQKTKALETLAAPKPVIPVGRPGRKITLLLGFKGAKGAPRDPEREDPGALRKTAPLSPDGAIQGHDSYKEKITLPGSPVDVSELVALPPGPGTYLRVRFGDINPIPFGRQRDKTRACVCFSAAPVSFGTDFSIP
ncbi:hypothetical protein JTE90_015391 [Oedothorax gibbosus]|uniref:Uncharacterized protein n=1 Tax=Oedothorax gibbosus TaxID=931172 RepID=A0AAV6TDS3_9ARAC|nr:hypothetical protein JTE90_015391 [Oedothorax gibbosus]